MESLKVIGIGALIAIIIILSVPSRYSSIRNDYTREIVVDDSSKVEQAISNAVNDVVSRNFIVKMVDVKFDWLNEKYVISCGGIDRGNLIAH